MATYTELYDQRSNDVLRNKIAVAVTVKAQDLLDGTPTAAQVQWASEAIADPIGKAGMLLNYVLAANKDATVQQINGASDAAIQANVDAAVDVLISGGT